MTEGQNIKVSVDAFVFGYSSANSRYILTDQISWNEEADSEFKKVFKDGDLLIDDSLSEIRKRLRG